MQITELELILFVALAVVTWLWATEYRNHKAAKRFLMLMLENKDAREQMVRAHEEFVRQNT